MANGLMFTHLKSHYKPNDPALKEDGVIVPSAVISIGWQIIRDEQGFYLVGQIARCKMGDQFNKKIARKIIEGRMDKRGPLFQEPLSDDWNYKDVYNMLNDLYHPDFGDDIIYLSTTK